MPDEFEAREVIVVDRKNGQSVFRRISEEKLKNWLEEYSLDRFYWFTEHVEIQSPGGLYGEKIYSVLQKFI